MADPCTKVLLCVLVGLYPRASGSIFQGESRMSWACFGENINASCQGDNKIIIQSVSLGAKPRSSKCLQNVNQTVSTDYRNECCKLNQSNDCISVTRDISWNLLCTGKTNCRSVPTKQSTTICRNNLQGILPRTNYMSMQYQCVEAAVVGSCTKYIYTSCFAGETVFLTSPGYPNTPKAPSSCVCAISSNCPEPIRAVAIDVSISSKEHMYYNDSTSSMFDKARNNQYIINDQFISNTSNILFRSHLENGRFLVAFKASCKLTIRCPSHTNDDPPSCSRTKVTEGFPWWWIVIALLSCIGIVLSYLACKNKMYKCVKMKHRFKRSSKSTSSLSTETVESCQGNVVLHSEDDDPLDIFASQKGLTNIPPIRGNLHPLSIDNNLLGKKRNIEILPPIENISPRKVEKEKKKKTKKTGKVEHDDKVRMERMELKTTQEAQNPRMHIKTMQDIKSPSMDPKTMQESQSHRMDVKAMQETFDLFESDLSDIQKSIEH